LFVGDLVTGEQVAECVSNRMMPEEFAKFSVAFCRWLTERGRNGPMLNWENQGPGIQFYQRVERERYQPLYTERVRSHRADGGPGTLRIGFTTSRDSKEQALSSLRGNMTEGLFVPRSVQFVEETRCYIYTEAGGIEYSPAIALGLRSSGTRRNHGDRVMAGALLNWMMNVRMAKDKVERKAHPPGSLGWVMDYNRESERERELAPYAPSLRVAR
jgi:hypothetical protein